MLCFDSGPKLFADQSDSTIAEASYDPTVTLRSGGAKASLWLFYPGVGEVLVYIGLAQHLSDDDRPVYVLRARGFDDGQAHIRSIADAVDIYVAAIRRKQPRSPSALACYSYGAMLAFEVAKKLQLLTGPGGVRFLGSFNLPPHIKFRMRQLDWNMCLLNLAYFVRLNKEGYAHHIDEAAFRALSRQQAFEQVLGVADRDRLEELGLREDDLFKWVGLAHGVQKMANDYDANDPECWWIP